ncbi:unannotated protein [freshwater metagenome]|uniref:Unannotated protein n=1 Tax=freshwater metagenome TaxID=449393 RepID=A0A6J6IGC5_9ZZZZ|nr:hypothetical protein [Actinomycetota bacterium]
MTEPDTASDNLRFTGRPSLSRRRVLGLGLLATGGLLLVPQFAAAAFASDGRSSATTSGFGENLLANPSFEDGVPGAGSPGWIFVDPTPVPP